MKDFTATSTSSIQDVQASVENTVVQLKKQGLLLGETVGPLVSSVSNKLNEESDELNRDMRQKVH